jgi:peptide/nickel transport system substrate-binding protein
VRSINTYDVQTFDRTKDIPYGDQSVITQGSTYNNHLWVSGPYIALYKNDYGIYFEKNPGFMPGTRHEPLISNYEMKFISDIDAQLSAFRSGETYVLYSVPTNKWDLVTNDPNLKLQTVPSNAVSYLLCNMTGVLSNVNLRLAVLYSIDQEDIIIFYDNNYYRAYTTLTPLVETGNVLNSDPGKVNDYLNKYWESQ